jgi:hypothetical protein
MEGSSWVCRVLLRYSLSRGGRAGCTLRRAYFALIFSSELCFIVAETLKLEHFLVLRLCHKTEEGFRSASCLSVVRSLESNRVLKTYYGISSMFLVLMQVVVLFLTLDFSQAFLFPQD